MSRDELLSRLSTEYREASKLDPIHRAKMRAALARVMRDLLADADNERVLTALKEKFPDVYRKLFEEGRV